MVRFLKGFFKLALHISAFAAVTAGIAFLAERIEELKNYGKEPKHKPYGIYERFVKRPLDCFLSTGALIVFSPILAVTAFLVKTKLGSPVLFTQERPGKDEKIFKLYKFRTMTDERDENGELMPDEVRLTKFGKMLRATSLDELPELINIVKGDMAVVGPRPLLVKYLPLYNEKQKHRHDVRPGFTGMAQVHGRNSISWEEKFDWDTKYAKEITFIGDVKIIAHTVLTVLKKEGINSNTAATMEEFKGSGVEVTIMDYSILKKNYIGLDYLRIISAGVVCMFHTTIHLGCNYGIFQGVSQNGAVFMTAFFLLSGFTLFANWGHKNLTDISTIKRFYIKRFLKIIPIYYFSAFIFDLLHIIIGGYSLVKTILLAPIEILGIQSYYSSLFSVSHNGGTWFISCILFCYLLFPYLQILITKLHRTEKIKILLCLIIILLYSPLLCSEFGLSSIYSNPLFRCMEFTIGMILASYKVDYKENKYIEIVYNYQTVLFTSIVMIILISFAVRLKIDIGNAMLYNWICLPCFIILILGLSEMRLKESIIIKRLSASTYVFYLAQLYSNFICKHYIIERYKINSNIIRIILGWLVCIVLTIILRQIELLFNYLINKNNKNYTNSEIMRLD